RTGGGYPHDHFAEFVGRFQGHPLDPFPDEATIQAQQSSPTPCSARYFLTTARPYDRLPPTIVPRIMSRRDYELVIDGYDTAIWYTDRHIGELLATLRELGIEEETGFVVSSDHGESWGEHYIYAEHAGATEPVHHVPLIISLPGVTSAGA